MALVVFASNRSPGCTTAVLAVAAAWPAPRRAVIAELDPDGGTIAARQILPYDPGLISLAAAGNRGVTSDMVARSIQVLANGTPALVAPPGPDRVSASLEALGEAGLGHALADLPGLDVLADCGRIDRRSPALPYLAEADLVVFVVRPTIEDVVGLQHRLQTLEIGWRGCGIVIVGRGPAGTDEVAHALALPILGTLDHDPRGAAIIGEGGLPRRSALLRSAGGLSDRLVRDLPAASPGPAASPEMAGPRWSPVPSALPPSSRTPR